MADTWYYTRGGQQAGPVSADEIQRLIASGQIGSADLVWRDGMAEWKPLGAVPELQSGVTPASPAAQQPTPGPAPFPQQQHVQPPPTAPLNYAGYSPQGGLPQDVPNYLVQAILVTLFCCLPLGIVAIVFAAQVNGHLRAGNYQAALSASKNAKTWTWVSFGLGLGVSVIWFILAMIGAVAGRH